MPHFEYNQVLQKIVDFPVIPVYYFPEAETTKSLLKACYDGGLRVFEYTNRGGMALEVFKEIYPFVRSECPEMALGVGTIYDSKQALSFVELGADFVVQPVITKEVADFCQKKNIVWIPGAATLNEIYQARLLGAEIVKVFPANVLGPEFIKAIKGPMPDVKLMVTGGVLPSKESLEIWFKAGVISVGIGSQLFPPKMIQEKQFIEIKNLVSGIVQDVKNIRLS